jgi:hypothetical protein
MRIKDQSTEDLLALLVGKRRAKSFARELTCPDFPDR